MEPSNPIPPWASKLAAIWTTIRDPLLFGFGIAIILTELVVWVAARRTPEPQLLVAGAGFVGLPAFTGSRRG